MKMDIEHNMNNAQNVDSQKEVFKNDDEMK